MKCSTCKHLQKQSQSLGGQRHETYLCKIIHSAQHDKPVTVCSVTGGSLMVISPNEFGCILHEEK